MPSQSSGSRRLHRRLERAGLGFEAKILERLVEREPDKLEHLVALGEAYTRAKRYGRGLDVDRRLVERSPENPTFRYNLACSLALTGDLDGATHELLQAVDLGFRHFKHMMNDADLRKLREDPRFELVRDRIRRLARED